MSTFRFVAIVRSRAYQLQRETLAKLICLKNLSLLSLHIHHPRNEQFRSQNLYQKKKKKKKRKERKKEKEEACEMIKTGLSRRRRLGQEDTISRAFVRETIPTGSCSGL